MLEIAESKSQSFGEVGGGSGGNELSGKALVNMATDLSLNRYVRWETNPCSSVGAARTRTYLTPPHSHLPPPTAPSPRPTAPSLHRSRTSPHRTLTSPYRPLALAPPPPSPSPQVLPMDGSMVVSGDLYTKLVDAFALKSTAEARPGHLGDLGEPHFHHTHALRTLPPPNPTKPTEPTNPTKPTRTYQTHQTHRNPHQLPIKPAELTATHRHPPPPTATHRPTSALPPATGFAIAVPVYESATAPPCAAKPASVVLPPSDLSELQWLLTEKAVAAFSGKSVYCAAERRADDGRERQVSGATRVVF